MNQSRVRRRLAAALILAVATTLAVAATTSAGTIAGQAQGKTIVIKLGHALADTHPQNVAALYFAKLVSQATKGQVQIKVFPNGQLGDDVALQEQVSLGALQMAIPGNTLQLAPRTGVFWLPYLFKTKEQERYVIGGAIGREVFADMLKKNIRVLSVFDGGFRDVTNSKRPIRSLADMNGLKLRVPGAPLFVDSFEALGANPTPMNFAELYTAMQQGTIDGQENPLPLIQSSKLYEVQKYVALTNHSITTQPLVISEKFWESLDKKTQAILQDAALKAQAYNYQVVDKQTKSALTFLKAHGMVVTAPYPAEFAKVIKEKVYPKYVPQYGQDLVDRIQAVKCVRKAGKVTCSG